MKTWCLCRLVILVSVVGARAQKITIDPQLRTNVLADHNIAVVNVMPHFVTTIRAPEPVNSVVVGDPGLFQVEHSEHEPELVFVKPLREESQQSNLLISTTSGRQISCLLVNHGQGGMRPKSISSFVTWETGGFWSSQMPFLLHWFLRP